MALDNLKDIGKSVARGIVGKNLRRVAGGIAGLIGGPNRTDSSDISPLRTKTSTTTLSFPLDVVNSDPALGNHGHYMMFFINEQENARIRFDNMQDQLSVGGQTLGQKNLQTHLEKNLGFTGAFDRIFDTKTDKFKEKASDAQKQIFDQNLLKFVWISGAIAPITEIKLSLSFKGSSNVLITPSSSRETARISAISRPSVMFSITFLGSASGLFII